jgi:dTDP-4-dehydrorhamnose 3,5-epimerase
VRIEETRLCGCYRLLPNKSMDERGSFVKIFHEGEFKKLNLETQFREEYYSLSRKNVLRGLHFQAPPMHYVKLVTCLQGNVMDVVVDIRRNSPTYGMHEMFDLNSNRGDLIYIPPGFAHGFYVTSDFALMLYKVTAVYDPKCDTGILWNSAGIAWPCTSPLISKRDAGFVDFVNFCSPFVYE